MEVEPLELEDEVVAPLRIPRARREIEHLAPVLLTLLVPGRNIPVLEEVYVVVDGAPLYDLLASELEAQERLRGELGRVEVLLVVRGGEAQHEERSEPRERDPDEAAPHRFLQT